MTSLLFLAALLAGGEVERLTKLVAQSGRVVEMEDDVTAIYCSCRSREKRTMSPETMNEMKNSSMAMAEP